jgi:hypothetical protein
MTDWPQIVKQHGPMVWRTVRRLLRHDADAADCFQRTFVSALELSTSDVILNWAALLTYLKLVDPDGANPITLLTQKVQPNGPSLELTAWW